MVGCARMMIAFVLTAGAAITSLGLAMATRIARGGPGRGIDRAVYVLVTVGWVFVVVDDRSGRFNRNSCWPARSSGRR